jgi:hypothetical protein
MNRVGYGRKAVPLLLGVVLWCATCAPAEQPLLEHFFDASRLRDKTELQKFSRVIFEPHEDGIVRAFTITSVGTERPMNGEAEKDVSISATVVVPDGRTLDERLTVVLARSDSHPGYPWVVTRVRDAAGRSAPPL